MVSFDTVLYYMIQQARLIQLQSNYMKRLKTNILIAIWKKKNNDKKYRRIEKEEEEKKLDIIKRLNDNVFFVNPLSINLFFTHNVNFSVSCCCFFILVPIPFIIWSQI